MKPNGDKCHFLVTTEKSVSINIDGSNVANKKEKKLLGIKFGSSLFFEGHIINLCKKDVSKTKCTSKNSQLYRSSQEVFNESIYYIPIKLLFINLDVT